MIHARGLTRTFATKHGKARGEVKAVAGVDVDVAEGEIVGFLGPNGAGKTTTLRMLTTLLKPTSGTATVAGYDLFRDPVKVRQASATCRRAGRPAATRLPATRSSITACSTESATSRRPRAGKELFGQLELEGMWERPTKTFSGGQRRRLDIAMGLVHDPRLVFLDEPTTGLDPQARANLWTHIADLRTKRGSTVFLTTHYLDEADTLCDRILVIDHGVIVASDTPNELKRQVSGDLVALTVVGHADVAAAAETLGRAAAAEASIDGLLVSARLQDGGHALPELLRALDSAGVQLASVEVRRPTLDDVFLTMTGRSLRESAA